MVCYIVMLTILACSSHFYLVLSAIHDPYHLLQQSNLSKPSQAAHCAAYYFNVKTSSIHNAASTSIQEQAILLSLLPAAQYNIKTGYYIQGQAMLPLFYTRPCNTSINAVFYPYKTKQNLN
ncbi:hypothetical protein V8B55DRAFT_1024558 [Mucor lusitanicus]|uniref:Uncharacterized protein n=1 Tax=Mucor circinelloides f. lusitanicus TaxID=29924 RepID=A0A8H4BUA7_MUCCL|nr:hypothetical protein FB192DRAFT_1025459 [Mucor lusitanicus]